MEQYITKFCAPYCNNATIDILNQVAKEFVTQVCKQLKAEDPEYLKKHIDGAMKKAVDDPKFVESILKELTNVSKSVKNSDFCKKKCKSKDKKSSKETSKEGEQSSTSEETSEVKALKTEVDTDEITSEDSKRGGKNKTCKKKLKKTQNKKYTKSQKKKYTKKNKLKLRKLKGGADGDKKPSLSERITKGVADAGNRFQNVIPKASDYIRKSFSGNESRGSQENSLNDNVVKSQIEAIPIAKPVTEKNDNSYGDNNTSSANNDNNQHPVSMLQQMGPRIPSISPHLSSMLPPGSMFNSQQTMASYINSAKVNFHDVLKRSVTHTDRYIRKDILKSIKDVIENNKDAIKKAIVDKVEEVTKNIVLTTIDKAANKYVLEYKPLPPPP